MPQKRGKKRLVVRCEKETFIRFRQYAAYHDNYEDALNALLDLAEGRKKLSFL